MEPETVSETTDLANHLQKKSYELIRQVKINFRFLHIFIKDADKIQYILPPQTKLLQVKKRVDDHTKNQFTFFLRQSFIPSLDSRIGDLAFCYGRTDGDGIYELILTASSNPHQYG